jgi:hypothetical protein
MNAPESNEKKLEALAEALRKAEARQNVFVPKTVDDAILKGAQRHFVGVGMVAWQRRFLLSLFFNPQRRLATLYCILAGLVPLLFVISKEPAKKFTQEDINRDGQVDILDAMALARRAGSSSSEVNAVALSAVRLKPPPRS